MSKSFLLNKEYKILPTNYNRFIHYKTINSDDPLHYGLLRIHPYDNIGIFILHYKSMTNEVEVSIQKYDKYNNPTEKTNGVLSQPDLIKLLMPD